MESPHLSLPLSRYAGRHCGDRRQRHSATRYTSQWLLSLLMSEAQRRPFNWAPAWTPLEAKVAAAAQLVIDDRSMDHGGIGHRWARLTFQLDSNGKSLGWRRPGCRRLTGRPSDL